MPAQRFQFRIIPGSSKKDCYAKYNGYTTKDPYTFYLFEKGGVGYLGQTLLFGNDAGKFNLLSTNVTTDDLEANNIYFVTADCTITDSAPNVYNAKKGSIWITDILNNPQEISLTIFTEYIANYIANSAIHASNVNAGYTPNDQTLMSAAAVQALINRSINSQSILDIAFFKNVSDVITVIADDITNGYVQVIFDGNNYHASIPTSGANATHEGDVGIVFQIQHGSEYDESDPSDNNQDKCIFVNLHSLLTIYEGVSSNTANVTIRNKQNTNHTKEILVDVNKSDKQNIDSCILDAINRFSNTSTDYNSAVDGFSDNKFITEKQFGDLMYKILKNFVQYSIDSSSNN
jgi:hypothetical protein